MSEFTPLTERERRSHPKKFEALKVIADHLLNVGPHTWNEVFAKFPDISQATMWRWIREAKKQHVPEAAPAIAKANRRASRKLKDVPIDRHEEAKAAGVAHIAKDLPAAPSPAYLARSGSAGIENLDFAVEIKALYSDANALRAYSVVVEDAPGGGKRERIRNPMTFERSIARRTKILETAIRTLQELWDLRTMQAFYETVIEEIGRESPDCQQRILQRLHDLNSRTGMTMSMRL